nr:hypothetical protein [Spirochaeta sp.]
NIYLDNGAYSSFYVDDLGRARRRWNRGYVLDRDVPYRYESELDARLEVKSASLTINYEMFSDTRFRADYGDRAESIDWSGLITQQSEEEEEDSVGEINSLRWESQLRWNPVLPGLRPWVTSFNVSSLRTELRWNTRDNADLPAPVARAESDNTPERRFFYPDSAVFPDLVVQLRGTLAELPRRDRSPEEESGESDAADADRGAADIRPPWESRIVPDAPDEDGFRLPERAGDLRGIVAGDPGSLALTYSLRPTLRVDRITDSDEWQTYEDVGFDWEYSTLQNRNRGSLDLMMISPAGWARYDGSLAAEQRYQSVTFLTDLEETEQTRLEQSAFAFRGSTITQTSTTTGYPLKEVYVLENSTLRHLLTSRVYERQFDGIDPEGDPQYETRLGEWSDEGISAHTGNATLRWRLWNAEQSFATETVLPPLDRAYLGTLSLVTGPLTSEFRGGYRETEDEGWKPDPFVQTHTLDVVEDNFVLEQRLEYDLDETELVQARSVGRLWPLRVELQGQRTTGLEFVPESGWTDTGEPQFRWTSLAIGLQAEPRFRFWRRRIDLGLTGILSFDADLQEFTRSGLLLDYGFDVDIYRFMTLEFSARSRNDLVYQYVPSLAEKVDRPPRDPLEDLVNSLRLFDDEARRDSFFKIESVEITAVHDLQDWELQFSYVGGPELISEGGRSEYEWQGVFAILFQWRAITEIRRDMRIEDGTLEFIES